MTSFLSANRRAEEFARAVDALVAGGVSATAVRPPTPVEPLIDVVLALRSAATPAARPEFTATLRQRLLAEAATVLAPGVPAAPSPRVPVRRTRNQGRALVAATALVAVGGTAGVATASQQALPGDALYPVKRALEGAELRLSTSDTGRGRDLLQQASHRLEEVGGLLPAAAGSAEAGTRLSETLGAFTDQAIQGSDLMLGAFREDGESATVVEVRTFAADSMATLSGIVASAPPDLVGDLTLAARAMEEVDATAQATCPGCDDATPLQVPPDFGSSTGVAATDDPADGPDGSPADGQPPAGVPGSGGWPEDGGAEADGAGPTGQPPGQAGPTGASPTEGGAPAGDPSPTGAPTDGPTNGGTDAPTEGPTDGGPTPDGSDGPTPAPSDGPTENPSDDPTENPGDDSNDDHGDDSSDGPNDEPSDDASDDGDDDPDETAETGSAGSEQSGDGDARNTQP